MWASPVTRTHSTASRDNAGNAELPPSIADAQTTVLQPQPTETTLSIAAASADKAEGNNGLTPFTFTVTRGGDTSGTTNVDFTVSGVGPNAALTRRDSVGRCLVARSFSRR